ncbi:MAG: hypothetical protein RLZZ253_3032, partial [Verrucomicrobiota bacterium]
MNAVTLLTDAPIAHLESQHNADPTDSRPTSCSLSSTRPPSKGSDFIVECRQGGQRPRWLNLAIVFVWSFTPLTNASAATPPTSSSDNQWDLRGNHAPTASKADDVVVRNFSGIYPHLAMFNKTGQSECGVGAVVNWAGRLWAVTYSPYDHFGSPDKLYRIDPSYQMASFKGSVGGTPANRMIHAESKQLLIGSYLVDEKQNVRVIPLTADQMAGRLTGIARHLTDPENKAYYATMEEGLYEVDVHTLAVKRLYEDTRAFRGKGMGLPGTHGKGLYSGQGRLVYSNNGAHNLGNVRALDRDFKDAGCLAEWNGTTWQVIAATGFLDVTGPGGLLGNPHPETDPIWAIGWDYRSVILKVCDGGQWYTYRLPKATHTYDGPHGYNTEWPRIGEIGSATERLIYTHGMFWRFPSDFTPARAGNIRPRSTYLKMLSDSTTWEDRLVFACNDISNETQAIRLNPRAALGKLTPAISHSNLWFVERDRLDHLGVPIGRGSVWMHDDVAAGIPSDAYQCGGWDKRRLHLMHGVSEPVRFRIEFDLAGNGTWTHWQDVMVSAGACESISLAKAPAAEWVRLTPATNATQVTAIFHYANQDDRALAAHPMFEGIARTSDTHITGGLVEAKSGNGTPLGLATADAYYELGLDWVLRPVKDPDAEKQLRNAAAIPEGSVAGLARDAASVLYVDEEDGKRYRLPFSNESFQVNGPLGYERICREVCRERNLFNVHGTLYELPYRNSGGFKLIRPVTTHNRRIQDFCTWRGVFVMTGLDLKTANSEHIIRSADGKAAVWLGVVDDIWKMGKAVGIGGPWQDSPVQAGVPSDPYLMTGYDRKTLTLSHHSAADVTITVEVDITGYGTWKTYRALTVPVGEKVVHQFPDDFNAYW